MTAPDPASSSPGPAVSTGDPPTGRPAAPATDLATPTSVPASSDAGPGRAVRASGADAQRRRILACALDLVSQRGAAGTSMRRLADACGLNVATIYHYFPSKADLLQALIEHQRYGQRLAAEDPPIDAAAPARERLATLLRWMWVETAAEHRVLRLIVGEGIRGDATARRSARALITALDDRLAQWMAEGFPELAERGVEPAAAARVVRRHLLSLVTESLVAGDVVNGEGADQGPGDLGGRAADDLASSLFD